MQDFPGYVSVWTDAKALLDAISHLEGEIAELCSVQSQPDDLDPLQYEPAPMPWEDADPPSYDPPASPNVLKALLALDEILNRHSFLQARQHWGDYDEASDYFRGCTDSQGDHALYRYFRAVVSTATWCESMLIEVQYGRGDQNVCFWPRKQREARSLVRDLEGVIDSFHRLPEVRSELLHRVRSTAAAVPEDQSASANNGATKPTGVNMAIDCRPAHARDHLWLGRQEDGLGPAADKADTKPDTSAVAADESVSEITPEERTIPMSYRRAAKLMGKGSSQDDAEWLSKSVSDGSIPCIHITRQTHVFSRNWFPKEVWPQIVPASDRNST